MSSQKEKLRLLSEMMKGRYGENAILSENPDPEHSLRLHNGVFLPRVKGDVLEFRGIPFALPPVGKLRWKAPLPVGEGEEIHEAYWNAKSPIQSLLTSERASLYPQSEDCLYLNLWLNQSCPDKKKPIMVFIHGGSYGWGGTADPLYDGENFIKAHPDVILITIAYRVGLLGFIDFSNVPGGEEYPDAPNLGILDQIEALRYIKKNAEAFGGDPENITVFGESAGGGSVAILPLIPAAKGLFHKVIAESGSVVLTFSKEDCLPLAKKLLKEAKASSVSELVALSEEEFAKINAPLNDYNNFPERDGKLIPIDPYESYRNGKTKDIPILYGTNANEMNYWIGEIGGLVNYCLFTPVKFRSDLRMFSKESLERARAFFKSKKGGRIWWATEFYNELMFRLPAIRQLEGHSKIGGKAYLYYWKEPSRIPMFRACHAVELAYVFQNVEDTVYTGKKADEGLANEVSSMWVNFAKTGDPS
ncbi:MAG: carboxylesterase/lipase family protein, partial [Bacilli bacterium]|nr:carboxylesterase/lipase family protein [Bacilli bacterium]